MWRIGFGLEKLGLVALRTPFVFSFILAVLTAFAAYNIASLRFDGNVTVVLPDNSKAFQDYFKLHGKYRNFSRDLTILIESDKVGTTEGLETLRDIQLEISLVEGVANTTSILSLPDFDPDSGELRDWFPQDFGDDAATLKQIKGLIEKYPQARSLLSLEDKVAVIIASLSVGVQDDDDESFLTYFNLRKTAQETLPEGYKLYFTGLTPVGATIVEAILNDQVSLTIFGLILGALIAFAIFRSLIAAFICAVPPALTAFWALGLFAHFEISVNYLTTILPTLALILAFADGIFLYFRWQALNSENADAISNLRMAVSQVGPACSLTSLTTATAFLSFLYAGSEALDQFAYLGACVVLLGFVGVIVGLPLVIYWLIRLKIISAGASRAPLFMSFGKRIQGLSLSKPMVTSLIGVIIAIALGSVFNSVRPEYTITDYLPKEAEVYQSELLANKVIGGRSLLLVSVPLIKEAGISGEVNIERSRAVEKILMDIYPTERIFSANSIISALNSKEALLKIQEMIADAPESARTDFLSNDGGSSLITVRLPSDQSVYEIGDQLDYLEKELATLSFGNEVIISGFPVLMSIEFTKLIDQLRLSLILAICLGVLFVGLATRSPLITIAAIVPNLIPIFFVQFLIFIRDGTINMTEVVALTVAFGIAIDNAVHLINVYDSRKRTGVSVKEALAYALDKAGPALVAGTSIICAATLVTQISDLPTVPVIGQFMVATLAVALFANLIFLPANILSLEKLKQNWLKR